MKNSIIAVGMFSFLIAGLAVAHSEQDGTGYRESIGDGSSISLVAQPAKEIAKEFAALESVRQLPKRLRVPLDDSYDYFPSSWSESY